MESGEPLPETLEARAPVGPPACGGTGGVEQGGAGLNSEGGRWQTLSSHGRPPLPASGTAPGSLDRIIFFVVVECV